MGLEKERVGFETNFISAEDWERVKRMLPRLEMVDCTRMMDEVRWIKTTKEIVLIKKIADFLEDAYLKVFPTIRVDKTERAIHSRIIYSYLRRGADWAHGILNSGKNKIPYGGDSDVTLSLGDVIRTDFVTYVQGYPGHQPRIAILGKPTAEQTRNYKRNRDIYLRTIELWSTRHEGS